MKISKITMPRNDPSAVESQNNGRLTNNNPTLAGSQKSINDLSTRDLTLKVTVENFSEVQKRVREFGIDKVEYGPKGELQAFTTKDGKWFEFPLESLEEFKSAGLLRLVRRTTR
jgi:hypothetical protein